MHFVDACYQHLVGDSVYPLSILKVVAQVTGGIGSVLRFSVPNIGDYNKNYPMILVVRPKSDSPIDFASALPDVVVLASGSVLGNDVTIVHDFAVVEHGSGYVSPFDGKVVSLGYHKYRNLVAENNGSGWYSLAYDGPMDLDVINGLMSHVAKEIMINYGVDSLNLGANFVVNSLSGLQLKKLRKSGHFVIGAKMSGAETSETSTGFDYYIDRLKAEGKVRVAKGQFGVTQIF